MENQNFRYYEFGDFKLDSRRRILLKNGSRIQLSSRIFDLLLVFVQNEGRILDHEELLDKVWEGMFVEQSNLKKSVSSLRQILGESPEESLYIKTIPRRGYSFVADVRVSFDEQNEAAYTDEITGENILTPEGFPDSNEKKIAEYDLKPAILPLDLRSDRKFTHNFWRMGKSVFILLGGVVLIGLISFFSLKYWRGTIAASSFNLENIKIQKLTTSGNIYDATISPDGKTIVFATISDNNKQTLWVRKIGSPNALQLVPASDFEYQAIVVSPDNNWIYYCVTVNRSVDLLYKIEILGGTPRKIAENISSAVTFSPDRKRIAFLRDKQGTGRTLLTANAEDGSDEKEIYTVADNHTIINPIWSPDGKRFTFVSSEIKNNNRIWTLAEIPAEGGTPQNIITPQRGKVYIFDWLRDGSGLIVCADPDDSFQSQLWYVSYADHTMTRLTNDVSIYQGISLSADGNTILAIQREKTGDLWSMNWSLLPNPTRITDYQNTTGHFTIFPDGRILTEYIENGQRGLWVINPDGSNAQPFLSQINAEKNPSLTPDGKSVLFTSRRSGADEIWMADLDGRNLRQLTEEKTFIYVPRVSPDGKFIFFGRYDGERWRLVKMPVQGGAITTLMEETLGVFCFSPDGKYIAYSYFDLEKRRWQAAIRSLEDNTVQNRFDISPSTLINWTPDGKNLIYNSSQINQGGGSLLTQPVDGGAPKSFFDAKEDKIFWVDWSPDKQKLLFNRGKTVSNIILLSKGNQN